ncbi:MAG: hypothetical protein RL042_889 [Nitrospirota bacterium]
MRQLSISSRGPNVSNYARLRCVREGARGARLEARSDQRKDFPFRLAPCASRRNIVGYVLRRNLGLSLTDTILTRSRTDKIPTTLLSSVTAR